MVTRDNPWPAGTPCWADVMSSDAAAAREFYRALFGWELGAEADGYTMASRDGRRVAGIGQLPPGHDTVWTCYLASEDADATAAAITAAGGTLIQAPTDVGDFGRMILALDSTGGFFGVWQARSHYGAQLANVSATMVWNEVLSADYAAARDFYAAVFGWTFTPLSDAYATFEADGRTSGGIGAGEGRTHWRTYFAVDDCDAAVAAAVDLGGTVRRPPADMPYGRHADLADPQGGPFSVITPAEPNRAADG